MVEYVIIYNYTFFNIYKMYIQEQNGTHL